MAVLMLNVKEYKEKWDILKKHYISQFFLNCSIFRADFGPVTELRLRLAQASRREVAREMGRNMSKG